MTGRLAGRTCLVTGATGMAADAARRFAAEGAAVVVIDRDARHCADLGVPYVVADLADEAATEAAFARIRRLLPRLDAAYAVAGGFKINIKDFGIEQPSYMGLTVKPEVDVAASFNAIDQ